MDGGSVLDSMTTTCDRLWLLEVFPEENAEAIEVEISGLERANVKAATSALVVTRGNDARVVATAYRFRNAGGVLCLRAERDALSPFEASETGSPIGVRRRLFVATGLGTWGTAAIANEVAGRQNRKGPGVMPAGAALRVLSGATLEPRVPTWPVNTMVVDLRMGEAVESSNLGKLTVVATRDTASLPSGSQINVTVTRGLSSEVATPDWTSRAEGHPICLLVADTLEGLAANTVSLDWSIGGTPYNASGPVNTLEPGNTRDVLFGGPLQKKAQAEWVSGSLVVGDLEDQ